MNDKLYEIISLIPKEELISLLDYKLLSYLNNDDLNLVNYYYNNFKEYINIAKFYNLFYNYALSYDELFFYDLKEFNKQNLKSIYQYFDFNLIQEDKEQKDYQEVVVHKRFLNY